MNEFIQNPLIKPNLVEARLYQEVLAASILEKGNSLVVAPTALGKTIVAALVAAELLKKNPNAKILFLAPTKPLAAQHQKSFRKILAIEPEKIELFTGSMRPKEREKQWQSASIVAATPQAIENDLVTGRIDLAEISLLVFDECLAGNVKVLLNDGQQRRIEELVKEFFEGKEFFVKSLDLEKQCFVSKKVTNAQKLPCLKKVLRIQTTSGKLISATEDHAFLVNRNGVPEWVKAHDLCFNDFFATAPLPENLKAFPKKVIVTEKEIIGTYSAAERKNMAFYEKAMGLRKRFGYGLRKISKILNYSERQIGNWLYLGIKPKPLQTTDAMKEIGLLPFTMYSPHIEIIAKLAGHLFGDGWISISKTGVYTLGFSGRTEDLAKIQNDLKSIGIKFSAIYSRKTSSKINGVAVNGTSNSFACTDRRLARLMYLLGVPAGKKTDQKTTVPAWVMHAPPSVKKAFLSSFFGSEGDSPLAKKNSRTFYCIRISLNKIKRFGGNGLKFLNQIKKLLGGLGVAVSDIRLKKGNVRKDGAETIKACLTVSNSVQNMINFFANVSYSYALEKEQKASSALHYLLAKQANISEKDNLKKEAILRRKEGFRNVAIAKMLNVPLHQIERRTYNEAGKNCLSTSFPIVPQYCGQTNIAEIRWEAISKIEQAQKEEYVYDLTVEDTHNFIANGIIVHNCHRAVGDYAYVFLAQRYMSQAKSPLILALTASPGGNVEKIQDVCKNLFVKNIEIKSQQDADVAPYVNEINVQWRTVDLPKEFFDIKQLLDDFIKDQLDFLKKCGYARNMNSGYIRKSELIALQTQIRRDFSSRAKHNPAIYRAASKLAALLKVSHAELLLETQGISILQTYFEKIKAASLQPGSPKALKTILADERIQKAMNLLQQLFDKNTLHPKQELLKEILLKQFSEKPDSKVIVFNHYRDSIKILTAFLKQFPKIKPLRFVGQATKEHDTGMKQTEQIEVVKRFEQGEFNTLVCSSVAEEGLDIPSVDLVIFYEPVPSEIRMIQRRGRTGRLSKGEVIILMAKRTRDEAFYWSAVSKEKKMQKTLQSMKKIGIVQGESIALQKQTTLLKFAESAKDKVIIFADTREQASSVVRELSEKGAMVKVKQLEIGDYVLSDDVIVERKTTEDFLQSMIDGRLFQQLVKMNENYSMPLVIIEGNADDLYSLRNIHRNAILGAITSIALNYRTPILFTKNPAETAELLFVTAKREQLSKEKDIRLRTGRKGLTLTEAQQFVVESLPMVGPSMAKLLLKKFKSVKNIFNAPREELLKVENLGEKKASRIRRLITARYDPNRKPKQKKEIPETTPEKPEQKKQNAGNSADGNSVN